jgi:hypothetical protein
VEAKRMRMSRLSLRGRSTPQSRYKGQTMRKSIEIMLTRGNIKTDRRVSITGILQSNPVVIKGNGRGQKSSRGSFSQLRFRPQWYILPNSNPLPMDSNRPTMIRATSLSHDAERKREMAVAIESRTHLADKTFDQWSEVKMEDG